MGRKEGSKKNIDLVEMINYKERSFDYNLQEKPQGSVIE